MACPSQNNEESLAPSNGRPAGGRTFFHRARTRPAACTMPRLSVGTWHSLGRHVGPHRKQACHNFLASLWHPLSFRILLVALNPYGETGKVSKLRVFHVSKDLCIRYKRAGSAWLIAAEHCTTTFYAGTGSAWIIAARQCATILEALQNA